MFYDPSTVATVLAAVSRFVSDYKQVGPVDWYKRPGARLTHHHSTKKLGQRGSIRLKTANQQRDTHPSGSMKIFVVRWNLDYLYANWITRDYNDCFSFRRF